jgi:hypothetical protein
MTCKDSSRKKADGMSSLVYRFYGIVGGYLTSSGRIESRFGMELMICSRNREITEIGRR